MAIVDDLLLLKKHKFSLLPYGLAKTRQEAKKLAKKMGYPVALKVVSEAISHKTDIGGVKIRILNEKRLENAYNEILENVGKRRIGGIMVQKMARKGVELIIGGKKDPQFGHMVVLGLGGIYVEIFRDVSARICPVSDGDVDEMVGELKAHPLLEGARGRKPIAIKPLRDMVKKTCRMMAEEGISEIDLNPVIFDHRNGDIVDVRIKRERR